MRKYQPGGFCYRFPCEKVTFSLPPAAESLESIGCLHCDLRQRLVQFSHLELHNSNESLAQHEFDQSLDNSKPNFEVNHLQMNVWPLMYAGFSLSIVGEPNSGKTTSYELMLINRLCIDGYMKPVSLSSFDFADNPVPNSNIFAIILTDTLSSADYIFRDLSRWFRKIFPDQSFEEDVRHLMVNDRAYILRLAEETEESNELDRFNDVVLGCTVLISSVESFIKLAESRLVPLNDNHILIIDNVNMIKREQLDHLLVLAKDENYDFASRSQVITVARNYHPAMKYLFENVQHHPILVTNSLRVVCMLFPKMATNPIRFSFHAPSAMQYSLFDPNKLGPLLLKEVNDPQRLTAIVCMHQTQQDQVNVFLTKDSQFAERYVCFSLDSANSSSTYLCQLKEELLQLLAQKRSLQTVKCSEDMKPIVVILNDELVLSVSSYINYFNTIIHLHSILASEDLPSKTFKKAICESKLNSRFLLGSKQFHGLCLGPGKQTRLPEFVLQNIHLIYATYHHLGLYRDATKMLVTFMLHFQDDLRSFEDVEDRDDELKEYIATEICSHMCNEYARIGRCSRIDDDRICWNGHHRIESCVGQPLHLQQQPPYLANHVKLHYRLIIADSPNEYYIGLKEYQDLDQRSYANRWLPITLWPDVQQALHAWAPQRTQNAVTTLSDLVAGQVYGVWQGRFKGQLRRVQLIELQFDLSKFKEAPFFTYLDQMARVGHPELGDLRATLRDIDSGIMVYKSASSLIKLSEELATMPAAAAKAVLVDIRPLDGRYFWYELDSTEEILSKYSKLTFRAWLLGALAVNGNEIPTIWITMAMARKDYYAENIGAAMFSNRMLEMGVAVNNDTRFMEFDYESLGQKIARWTLEMQASFVRYSYLRFDERKSGKFACNALLTAFEDFEHVYAINIGGPRKLVSLEHSWQQDVVNYLKHNENCDKHFIVGQLAFHLCVDEIEVDSIEGRQDSLQVCKTQTIKTVKRCEITRVDKQIEVADIIYADYGCKLFNISFDNLMPIIQKKHMQKLDIKRCQLVMDVNDVIFEDHICSRFKLEGILSRVLQAMMVLKDGVLGVPARLEFAEKQFRIIPKTQLRSYKVDLFLCEKELAPAVAKIMEEEGLDANKPAQSDDATMVKDDNFVDVIKYLEECGLVRLKPPMVKVEATEEVVGNLVQDVEEEENVCANLCHGEAADTQQAELAIEPSIMTPSEEDNLSMCSQLTESSLGVLSLRSSWLDLFDAIDCNGDDNDQREFFLRYDMCSLNTNLDVDEEMNEQHTI